MNHTMNRSMKRKISVLTLVALCATASAAFAQELAPVSPQGGAIGRPAATAPAPGSAPVVNPGNRNGNASTGLSTGTQGTDAATRSRAAGLQGAPTATTNSSAVRTAPANDVMTGRSIPAGAYVNEDDTPAAAPAAAANARRAPRVRNVQHAAPQRHAGVTPDPRRNNSVDPLLAEVSLRVEGALTSAQVTTVRRLRTTNPSVHRLLMARLHAIQSTSAARGLAEAAAAIENEILAADQYGKLVVGPKVGRCTADTRDAQGNVVEREYGPAAQDRVTKVEASRYVAAAMAARLPFARVMAEAKKAYLEGGNNEAGWNALVGHCEIFNAAN